jgi:hypothetical protein
VAYHAIAGDGDLAQVDRMPWAAFTALAGPAPAGGGGSAPPEPPAVGRLQT